MADALELARENIEAFNAADWSRLKATLAPDSVYQEMATHRRIEGPDGIVEALQGWKTAFPDATGTILSSFTEGSKVTMEVRWDGTHTGPLEGPAGTIPPSGKSQSTEAALVLTCEGDKIVENHHYFDMMTLLQQIGAIPAAGG